jgi:hypothetical protein
MATGKAKKPTKKPARKPAPRKAARAASRPKATSRAAAGGGLRPIAIGETEVFGTTYRVIAPEPRRVQRELRFTPADKADIRGSLGDRVHWSAPRDRPFRIEFTRVAPDASQPDRRSFVSRLSGGRQRVEVVLQGHLYGTVLDYDIFSPPKSTTPLDPSIIIEPNTHLKLVAKDP